MARRNPTPARQAAARAAAPSAPPTVPDAALLKTRLRLKHVELFKSVCEHRTLSRAAEACAMTQPAATKLVQELEDMFNVPLFERGRRGMKPTPYGEVIQRHVPVLLADIGAMHEEVRRVAQGSIGQVRLGIVPSLSSDLLSLAIADTMAAFPRVQFRISEEATTPLLESLRRNDLDLSFGRVLELDIARELRIAKVYEETFVIAARAGHPLARTRNPPWNALAQATWVLPEGGTPMRDLVDGLFTSNLALRPHVAVECSSLERISRLVARTDMIGILSRSIFAKGAAAGELARVGRELAATFAPISLLFRKQFDAPPVVRHFEAAVHDAARKLKLA